MENVIETEKLNSGVDTKSAKGNKKKDKAKSARIVKEAPNAAHAKRVAKIKEVLAKEKEREEQRQRELEEEERKLEEERLKEEAERARLQEIRLQKKQKEKEKKERLKAEGKAYTPKQKENQRKALALIKSRGFDIPEESTNVQKKIIHTKLKKRHTKVAEVVNNTHCKENEEDSVEDLPEEASWEVLAKEINLQNTQVASNEDDAKDEDSVGLDLPSNSTCAEMNKNECDLSEEEKAKLIELTRERIKERHEKYNAARSPELLRSGVICILGHVDTGKTKLLDKLRNTQIQAREAGGITQQIGATNVPIENIIKATSACTYLNSEAVRLPGLLMIDTPGHESFSNLRVRGSSLCDLAILVVDLMHGLEEQTKESIKILLKRKTPFVVALNKVDRLYEWKSNPTASIKQSLSEQSSFTTKEFKDRFQKVVNDFALMEINVELFYKNKNLTEYISMVPTSAHTGDGLGDLLACICLQLQNRFCKKIAYSEELQASVMEVKEINGLGTTIDVILVNGKLNVGDTIVLAGQEGPFVTQLRDILQPAPMSELRVKGSYHHLKEVKGAQGVKLIGKDMELALAGFPLYVATDEAEVLYYKDELQRGLKEALKAISVSPAGVYVVASTLGSLESLLVYLKSVKIPYSGINIGTVHKKDVMKASAVLDRDAKLAVILAFDVRIDKDAQKLATQMGVRIFTSDTIYRLHAQIEQYMEEMKSGDQMKNRNLAVFPVKLSILPDKIFNKRAPIIIGVRVESGILRVGTPICVPERDFVNLGRIFSIESNHKSLQEAREGAEVCVRIDSLDDETPKLLGRHFDETDILVSKISRESIDMLKDHFRSEMKKEDWNLIIELKKTLSIT